MMVVYLDDCQRAEALAVHRPQSLARLRRADLIETEQRYRKNDAKSSLLYKLKPK